MKLILIVVLFKLILIFDLCCAYMPVYHVANQDLLKGILLGALLTQHKHPPQFLMPMPYYNGYGTQSSQPYGYPNPTQSGEQKYSQPMHPQEDKHTDQSNASSQQMESHSSESDPQHQQQDHQTHPSAQRQHQSEQQYHHQQQHHHQQPQQQYQQNHQRSESLFEPVVTDPPTNQPPQPPHRAQPNIPSMETIQRNLGFPGHSVILMILPSFDTNKDLMANESKEPNRTDTRPESPEPEQNSSEQDMVREYEHNLKTNAVKIGSKHLNPRGWKPVPKFSTTTTATTTTPTPEPTVPVEYNDRFSRYNMNNYIERSQFGLRNKDLSHLNRNINQYYSIDQMHD